VFVSLPGTTKLNTMVLVYGIAKPLSLQPYLVRFESLKGAAVS